MISSLVPSTCLVSTVMRPIMRPKIMNPKPARVSDWVADNLDGASPMTTAIWPRAMATVLMRKTAFQAAEPWRRIDIVPNATKATVNSGPQPVS